jgi:hypothetical protein
MKNAFSFFTPLLSDMANRLAYKAAIYLGTGLGLGGVDHFADAAAHAGDWWCLHAVSDTVISSVTYASGTSSGSLAGATILAGDRVYGNITGVTLTSGRVEMYRAMKQG